MSIRLTDAIRAFACFITVTNIDGAMASDIPRAERQSGYALMTDDTRAMQDNDRANPAMLSVLEGEKAWRTAPAPAAKSCQDCHGAADISMRGVAARYPVFDERTQTAMDVQNRIRQCQSERQGVQPAGFESRALLSLSAYIGLQSRGMAITQASDERLQPFLQSGHTLYRQRMGQLNFSCSQCHDDNWGKKLGGSTIPQGQATGYPIYRLEWQSVGSLQRRIRNCMTGVRAEPFGYGVPEMIALELYLMQRANGMLLETPAVRP